MSRHKRKRQAGGPIPGFFGGFGMGQGMDFISKIGSALQGFSNEPALRGIFGQSNTLFNGFKNQLDNSQIENLGGEDNLKSMFDLMSLFTGGGLFQDGGEVEAKPQMSKRKIQERFGKLANALKEGVVEVSAEQDRMIKTDMFNQKYGGKDSNISQIIPGINPPPKLYKKGGKVSNKIKKLRKEGKPQDQAVAIALDMQRRGKLQKGGKILDVRDTDLPLADKAVIKRFEHFTSTKEFRDLLRKHEANNTPLEQVVSDYEKLAKDFRFDWTRAMNALKKYNTLKHEHRLTNDPEYKVMWEETQKKVGTSKEKEKKGFLGNLFGFQGGGFTDNELKDISTQQQILANYMQSDIYRQRLANTLPQGADVNKEVQNRLLTLRNVGNSIEPMRRGQFGDSSIIGLFDPNTGSIGESINDPGTIFLEPGYGRTNKYAPLHEFTHAAHLANRMLTDEQLNIINRSKVGPDTFIKSRLGKDADNLDMYNRAFEDFRYLSNPTEVHSRINEVRKMAVDLGMHKTFGEPFTKAQLKRLGIGSEGDVMEPSSGKGLNFEDADMQPLFDLIDVTGGNADSILDLLNRIAVNQGQGDGTLRAQDGGFTAGQLREIEREKVNLLDYLGSGRFKRRLKRSLRGDSNDYIRANIDERVDLVNEIFNGNNIIPNQNLNPKFAGQYNPSTHQIEINPDLFTYPSNTAVHELTHASTRGDQLLPDVDIAKMKSSVVKLPDFFKAQGIESAKDMSARDRGAIIKDYRYLTRPTEMHARINEVRQLALDTGLHKKFGQKFTKRDLEALTSPLGEVKVGKDVDLEAGQAGGLIDLMLVTGNDKEKVRELLNTIAFQNVNPTSTGVKAQDGGTVPVSEMGMYEYPNQPVLVPTPDGRITMKGIDHDILALQEGGATILPANSGIHQLMPGVVLEIPIEKKRKRNKKGVRKVHSTRKKNTNHSTMPSRTSTRFHKRNKRQSSDNKRGNVGLPYGRKSGF